MSTRLPWQEPQWGSLRACLERDNLPHALLLSGRRGIGKRRFSQQFAELLLCQADQPQPCGECKGCRLIEAGSHPDFKIVAPEADKRVISVDQIRELTQYLSLTAMYGGYQVVIISPADWMNANAANSLLKTLEEPPARTLLMLLSDRPAALTATIRSRCQQLHFEKPAEAEALAWLHAELPQSPAQHCEILLELADGAPLRALEMEAGESLKMREEMLEDLEKLTAGRCDPVEITKKWLKLGMKESLYWIYGWLVDMVRMKIASRPPYLTNTDIAKRLEKMAVNVELVQLYRRLDQVSEALKLADNTAINAELLLEGVLIGWTPSRR